MKINELSPYQQFKKQEIALIAAYKLDGTIKGKNLNKYIQRFINKYGAKAKKQFKAKGNF